MNAWADSTARVGWMAAERLQERTMGSCRASWHGLHIHLPRGAGEKAARAPLLTDAQNARLRDMRDAAVEWMRVSNSRSICGGCGMGIGISVPMQDNHGYTGKKETGFCRNTF